MAFKKAIKLVPIKFSEIETLYKWNKNTKELEPQEVNIQEEINQYKGMDLKSMFEKNIMPSSEEKGTYLDTTIFKDKTALDILNANDMELVVENESINNKKENEEFKKINNKDINENEINNK